MDGSDKFGAFWKVFIVAHLEHFRKRGKTSKHGGGRVISFGWFYVSGPG